MNQSRKQFEARYPVPQGVEWKPESSRYALVEIKTARNTGSTIARYEAYVHSWGVWKASREAVQVTLPRLSFYIGHNVPGSVDYLDHLRNTLEAAGVEVRP